ncbi:metallophosphoesterase family protein [Cecembia rubra]|uniref:metallophosphoesterase family protein n=1 Tax=Cecembia rubra TaxID=1485585 RepID=UPI002714582D|nr:metallophosphoesterase [Cecembia rubra]
MKRRPFLKKLTFLTSMTSLMPFLNYGKMEFPEKTKLKFIVASDGHYGQPNTEFEASHKTLLKAIQQEQEVDFVVFNGDLIHDDPKWMPEVKKVYDSLKLPYFPVKGNHDRISETAWQNIWGIPADHRFVWKEHFGMILANSSNQAGEYLCADTEFLKSSLEEFKNLAFVFVFVHISQNDWTLHGVSCDPFLELMARYSNVRAIFHGHDHDVNGIMRNRKKPYLWSGHFGGSWGSPHPSYRVCEVGGDGKVITYLKSMNEGMILSGHTI